MLADSGMVSDQIQMLRSRDRGTHEQAMQFLRSSLVHQGSRFQWSIPAVLELAELLDENAIQGKDEIINLLIDIAIGYYDEYMPGGINSQLHRQKLIRSGAKVNNEGGKLSWRNDDHGPTLELACYEAVQKEVPRFIDCLQDADKSVRTNAIYALAWFTDEAAISIPRLQSLLMTESEVLPTASALISLALLAKNSPYVITVDDLIRFLGSESAIIRASAAMALVINGHGLRKDIITALVDATMPGEHLVGCSKIPFYAERGIWWLVLLVLENSSQEMKDLAIEALCAKYERGGLVSYEPLFTVRAIITLVMSVQPAPSVEQDVQNLTSLQRRALTIFADFGKDELVAYSEISDTCGMKISPQNLGAWLAGSAHST